jgi:hypothetical protein
LLAVALPRNGMPKAYCWPQGEGDPEMEGRFEGEYLPDRLSEEACRFVDENRDRPFFLCMRFYAVRAGRWKLLEHFETGRVKLYDLEKDLGETNDPAQAEPSRTRKLRRMLSDWRESVDAKMPDQPNPKYRRM